MSSLDIERAILTALYEAWAISDGGCNLHSMRDELGWSEGTFQKVVDRMEHENLIEPASLASHVVTSRGIIYAEDNHLASLERVQENKDCRTLLFEALAKLYDEEGPYARSHYTMLARDQSLDENLSMKNLHVLRVLGYLEEPALGCYKLSHKGLATFEDYENRRGIVDEFESVRELQPHARGRALQKLLARVFEYQGWPQLEGLRTSNEEIDIIVNKGREYYFIECKWEKCPVQTEVVDKLVGKLVRRPDVKGIVASMSGFTKGIVEAVKSHANTRVILLFGSEDLMALIHGRVTLEALIDEKYREFVTRQTVLFR